jgi:hypothetical protein
VAHRIEQEVSTAEGGLFRIDWNRHSPAQQQAMLDACARPTLPQTPAYAAALVDAGHAEVEFGLLRFRDRPVGYVFVERRPLIRWVSSYRVYRGPLWLDGDLPGTVQREFFRLLRQRYRLRRRRPVTFHPEMPDTSGNRQHVTGAGFRRIAHGYETIWLDLSPPADELRARLDAKWRNRLGQSERFGLQLASIDDDASLDWLIGCHEEHMAAHIYQGPSRRLLEGMMRHGRPHGMIRILRAFHGGEPVAGILLARHGASATYFVGWNGPAGRTVRAHHFLLWQAVRQLQDDGVRWFDLGGVNDADAARVARFKSGLAGERVKLVGGYT